MPKEGLDQKQHHYIPVTYLRNFVGADGLITICNMGAERKIFRTATRNVLKERYLYTQPVHAENRFDNKLERFFSEKIETNWHALVQAIKCRDALDRQQIADFIEFMLALRVRVPITMRAVQSVLREKVKKASNEIKVDIDIPESVKERLFEITGRQQYHEISYTDLIESGIITINIDPHMSIVSMANLIHSMMPIMSRVNSLHFIHNETDTLFISSDNPVVYFIPSRNLHGIVPYDVDIGDDFNMIMPVTDRISLCIDSKQNNAPLHRTSHSKNTIERINLATALFSDNLWRISRVIGACRRFLEYLSSPQL